MKNYKVILIVAGALTSASVVAGTTEQDRLKNLEAKASQFETATKKGAENYRNRCSSTALSDVDKALDLCRRATQLDPENIEGWNQLGHSLERAQRFDDAIAAFQTALRLGELACDGPGVAITHVNLGAAYKAKGNPAKALDHMKAALNINQENLKNQPHDDHTHHEVECTPH